MKEVKTLVLGKKKRLLKEILFSQPPFSFQAKKDSPQPFIGKTRRKPLSGETVLPFHLFYQVGQDKRFRPLHSFLY